MALKFHHKLKPNIKGSEEGIPCTHAQHRHTLTHTHTNGHTQMHHTHHPHTFIHTILTFTRAHHTHTQTHARTHMHTHSHAHVPAMNYSRAQDAVPRKQKRGPSCHIMTPGVLNALSPSFPMNRMSLLRDHVCRQSL